VPFQYLLADAILCMGASNELVKMFNRLGSVASLDTQDRIATAVVTLCINKGIHSEPTPHALTGVEYIGILHNGICLNNFCLTSENV